MVSLFKSFVLCLTCVVVQSVFADLVVRPVSQLSELISLKQTTSFRYQETRSLELLDQPWQGSGLMLASTDGTLIKLQMMPQRKIMAITPGEMIYFDSENKERHRLPLSVPHPMTRQALIFLELFQGKSEKILTDYDLHVSTTKASWYIRLKPKLTAESAVFKDITMSGNVNNSTRLITLSEKTGDSSTIALTELEQGPQLEFMIERLLREAVGQ